MPDRPYDTGGLDFVPAWYADMRRRRPWVVVQGTLVAILAIGLALNVLRLRAGVARAQQELNDVRQQMSDATAGLARLDALAQLHDQLRRQDRVLASAGVNVETSRLLGTVERILPPDTSLTDFAFEVIDPKQDGGVNGEPPAPATRPVGDGPQPQRRLRVRLAGLAPDEVAVGNLLAGLNKTPIFRQVDLTRVKEQEAAAPDGSHGSSGNAPAALWREFEVTFHINLSPEHGG